MPRVRGLRDLLCVAAALAIGVVMLAPRLDAQEIPDAGVDAEPLDAPPSEAPAPDDADVAAPSTLSPLDYAVLPTEEDVDETLSEEQQIAIGNGLVPIHREGPFRSPLAHPRFGPAAHVRVGLVLNRIRDYDIHTGSFSADYFLSLTGDRTMPPIEVRFTNGADVTTSVLAETPTFRAYRMSGTFTSAVDLRHYPFDTQSLTIEMEAERAGVDQVVFEADPNRTSLDEGFSVAGWGVATIGARAYRHRYPPRFDHDDLYVSRYVLETRIERFGTSAAFSVFVPALIIVLIGLTGLWVPPARVDVRSNTGAPMLAAAVLFHYSLMQSLPATGYLTRADKVMLGLYVSLLLNMISTWAFFIVDEKHLDRVFVLSRNLIPPITVAILVAAVVL